MEGQTHAIWIIEGEEIFAPRKRQSSLTRHVRGTISYIPQKEMYYLLGSALTRKKNSATT